MDKNEKNEDFIEEKGFFDEADLKELVKEAVKEANKECTEEEKENFEEVVQKYNGLKKKEKLLKILEDEKEKALLKLCTMDVNDPKYEKTLHNYERLCSDYDNVKANPFKKVDWTRILTTAMILGGAALLIILVMVIENCPAAFMRTKNALNLILALAKKVF